jgi:hypothetical protein
VGPEAIDSILVHSLETPFNVRAEGRAQPGLQLIKEAGRALPTVVSQSRLGNSCPRRRPMMVVGGLRGLLVCPSAGWRLGLRRCVEGARVREVRVSRRNIARALRDLLARYRNPHLYCTTVKRQNVVC